LKLPTTAKGRVALLAVVLAVVLIAAGVVSLVHDGGSGTVDVEKAAAAPSGGVFDLRPYEGLGTWVDVFDYVPAYQQGHAAPPITAADVEVMAALGIKAIFLQAARLDARTPDGVVAASLIEPILEQAHRHGIKVVGWYYPTFVDVAVDLDRLLKIVHFESQGQRFDGVAVDIEENQAQPNVATRNANLVELSKRLRAAVGPKAVLAATVMPNVVTDVINPKYWPAFPWKQIKPYYNVWQPMTYWSLRSDSSPYHSGYAYVTESVRRLRAQLGEPSAPVDPIGGIADAVTEGEVRDFLRAVTDTNAIGASLYDYRTTNGGLWGVLRQGLTSALAAPPGPTTTLANPTTTAPPAPG
jgi:hypothetical protein